RSKVLCSSTRYAWKPAVTPDHRPVLRERPAPSQRGRSALAGEPCLGIEADRRVDSAEAFVALALYHLEEEQILEARGVELKVLAVAVPVVKDVVVFQPFEPRTVDVDARFEIVVVIFRNAQDFDAAVLEPGGGQENVAGGKGDVLHARAEILIEEAGRLRTRALACVERNAESAVGG